MVIQREDKAASDRVETVLRTWNDSSLNDWIQRYYPAHLEFPKSTNWYIPEKTEAYLSLGAELLADRAIAQMRGYHTVEDMIRGELELGDDFSFGDE